MQLVLSQQMPGIHLHLGGEWQMRITALPKDVKVDTLSK